MSTAPTARRLALSNAALDAKRKRGDPRADKVVAEIIENGEVKDVDRILLGLWRDDQPVPADLPEVVREYLIETGGAPEVSDSDIQLGQDVFADYGPEILMTLGFYSLPASYAARKGVQVLYRTAFLAERPMRRVFETTRMMIDVMTPGGIGPTGRGVRTIQKVRLMHASIRYMLQHDPNNPWDESLGVPINQEDLAGTLMTFSYVVLTGLERLGIKIPADQAESYIRVWSGIGGTLGLDPDLRPSTMAQAGRMTKRIRERQIEASPEGKALTLALVDGYAELLGHLPDDVPAAMVHYFLDSDPIMHEDVASLLDVPTDGWTGVLKLLIAAETKIAKWIGDSFPIPIGTMRWLSRELVTALLTFQGSGEVATFSIPDKYYKDWEIDLPGAEV